MKHKLVVTFEIEAPTRKDAIEALQGAFVDQDLASAVEAYVGVYWRGADLNPELFSKN